MQFSNALDLDDEQQDYNFQGDNFMGLSTNGNQFSGMNNFLQQQQMQSMLAAQDFQQMNPNAKQFI